MLFRSMAGGSGSDLGTGGMTTKIHAARIATSAGIPLTLLPGRAPRAILDLVAGRPVVGTRFPAPEGRQASRRRWLASADGRLGSIRLDDGAVSAVRDRGKSLLPAGIRGIDGSFPAGSVVRMLDGDDRVLGQGLTNYGDEDLRKIMGHPSDRIEALLGHATAEEAIHRNDMVLFDTHGGQP